jgi:two-component system OmpR family response regulator/two-component system response regulator QseB
MGNMGKVVSKARLEESLYSWDSDVESNTIEVYIHYLRKKLDPTLIRTVRGVGYIIDNDAGVE